MSDKLNENPVEMIEMIEETKQMQSRRFHAVHSGSLNGLMMSRKTSVQLKSALQYHHQNTKGENVIRKSCAHRSSVPTCVISHECRECCNLSNSPFLN